MNIQDLQKTARKVRRNIIESTGSAGSGHPGGSLSCTDILTTLYFSKLRVDPKNPKDPNRDRFVLSKGHAAPALYSVLAEKGFFPTTELKTLRKLGSILQGHPNMNKTPGVDASTGSLGQGLSIANGMALAAKMDKKSYRVYAVIGDGETQEGSIWEAAMTAAHYKLDNLCVILDHNGLQIDGANAEVMNIEPIGGKFSAFGWNVLEADGHNFNQILKALDDAESLKGKPTVIIARTIKGKGVKFMENRAEWHGRAPKEAELEKALEELTEE